jgi:predicted 2-oxoglutarate/Fe(II)-dependent dioxygenase YbiX
MFDITKLALKIPNFLSHEECNVLINEYKQRKDEANLESSGNVNTGKIENSSFTVVHLKPYTNNFNFIKEKTKLAVDKWTDYLSQPNYFFPTPLKEALNYSHDYRIMEYKTNAEIHPHSDHIPNIYGSVSFNLNDNYEGGEFKFFNGKYTVTLNKGDALIFPADYFWVHEVSPVTKGTRYSLNSFLSRYPYPITTKLCEIGEQWQKEYLESLPPEELLGPYN